ncbi:PEP-CTERM sorting domain-containing protein [Pseudoduganella sp. LjRoot289]|uniref:PEP-CTERM sorting domain-containing protein n=1 Tax=Pseudoduganella sp. LjRoot289 TaxID=3342314 RepID=UPI003ECE0A62
MGVYAIDSALTRDTLELWHDGGRVTSFSLFNIQNSLPFCTTPACISGTNARGILNIDGLIFDEFRFTKIGDDTSYLVFDNVGFTYAPTVVPPRSVPEPGTALLIALGLLGVVLFRKRDVTEVGRV